MLRSVLFVLSLLFTISATAQYDWYNSDAFWSRLTLDAAPPSDISAADTPFVIVSNRRPDANSPRFMSQQRDNGTLHYFLVYSRNGLWHIYETANLAQSISLMPDKDRDWVAYVEGMGKLFTSDLERGFALSGMYGVNTLMFDYPSINTSKKQLGNYFFAMHNARTIYKDFTPVLAGFRRLRLHDSAGTGHLSLLFHSMGNNMIRESVRHKQLGSINECVWVDNLILNAPCVPQAGHRKWLGKVRFAKNIYVHYNPGDFTLGGAYLVSKKNQLGMKVKRHTCDNACYINFNTLVGKEHSYFLDLPNRYPSPPEAKRHFTALLHGSTIDTRLPAYTPSAYRHIGWDIVPDRSAN